MLATFSPSDLNDFATIPAKWRTEADIWTRAISQLKNNQITKHELCKSMQVSRSTLDRKIQAYDKSGWRGLIKNYKGPTTLCNDFVKYWKTLQESYQRKTAPAYRELVRRWKDRHPIPGYAGHPGWPNLPDGWDDRNLYRYQPPKLDLTALRHGLGRAIAKHAPKTYSTRVGLWHLSHIVYDDVKIDVKSHIGTSKPLVCGLQIGAQDLLSTDRFTYGMKPQLVRPDGSYIKLGEADMRYAFAQQLYHYGISQRGSTIVIEHGTATLRDRVIDICRRYLGDRIDFSLSGMTGKMQAIAGMGDGKGGGGNFRHKAVLESLHNLMHNELAFLPGQTGHDRDEPEHLSVMQRQRDWLLRLARDLPQDVQALFRYSTLEYYTQLTPVVKVILDRMNCRPDHDIEGWLECGFFDRAYRLMPESAEWLSESRLVTLPPAVQSAYLSMAETDNRCLDIRKLSPREAFNKGAANGEVMQVPNGMIAEILYEDLAEPRTCYDGHFTFEDRVLSLGKLRYESRITTAEGREIELKDRETYDTVVNPFDLSIMWVFSAVRNKGAFLGIAKRDVGVNRADVEGTTRKWARAKQRLSDLLADTQARNIKRTEEAAEINNHNAKVVEQYKAGKAEKTRAATKLLTDTHTANETVTEPTTYDPRKLWKQ